MAMGARLKAVLKDRGMNQADLARISGVDEGTISALIKRDSSRSDYTSQLAQGAGVSIHWLLTGEGDRDVKSISRADVDDLHEHHSQHRVGEPTAERSSRYVMIRRVSATVSAGSGSLNEHEEIEDYIAFRRDWLQRRGFHASQLVVVEVEGDSMSPTLEQGDVLLVNVTDKDIKDGRIYAFRVHGNVRVKRFQRSSAGGITISSDNKSPRYGDETLSAEQLESLDILGRVVWGGGEL